MGFLKLAWKKKCIRSLITQWRWHNEFVTGITVLLPLLHSAPALISLPLSRHSTGPQHEISLKFNVPFPDFENHIRFGWHFASHNLNPNTSMGGKKKSMTLFLHIKYAQHQSVAWPSLVWHRWPCWPIPQNHLNTAYIILLSLRINRLRSRPGPF